ncbi:MULTISPECIES: glycosyltransferase [unclassified Curtobacterium]|uniref:glycosyltransferase n=1 Tax=unclassified Curtobacterium TaxID=257496 RepID=UPI002785E722|nr:glycosyltransferase [Curtobacterium sp. 260]MDP9737182.1 glycosyltransferase involved in cell wall biosynthesis [Curtobacterium sp. 260]
MSNAARRSGLPLVTVAVPTVRLDAHLDAAVASVLTQTIEDLEVVVALDGVPLEGDRPSWMADPRVRVLKTPSRQGTAATLNTVLGATHTPFFARLDADDIAEPHRLERQIAALDEHPEWAGVGSAATVIDQDGRPRGHIDVPTEDTARQLLRRNVFVHSAMVLRRPPLERVGGYDPGCVRMQDYDLWLRLSATCTLGNVGERLVQYRVHDGMHSRRTRAFSASARRVIASRRRLARSLGTPVVLQSAHDLCWTAGQALRNAGLRRPRYLVTT